LQAARFAEQESRKTAHLDLKIANRTLKQKVEAGKVTKADLNAAAQLAKRNGSEDNRVLYATIKNLLDK
jgi:hypothetical protein